jgi:hypothetical protein
MQDSRLSREENGQAAGTEDFDGDRQNERQA